MSSEIEQAPAKQFLHVGICEASGLDKNGRPLWDKTFTEGYVRVSIRGENSTRRFDTTVHQVVQFGVQWHEETALEVMPDSRELRVLLYLRKQGNRWMTKKLTLVAAAGIWMKDILREVSIDKWFDLFGPLNSKESTNNRGCIKLTLTVSDKPHPDVEMTATATETPQATVRDAEARRLMELLESEKSEREKDREELRRVSQELKEVKATMEDLRSHTGTGMTHRQASISDAGRREVCLKIRARNPFSCWTILWNELRGCIPALFLPRTGTISTKKKCQ